MKPKMAAFATVVVISAGLVANPWRAVRAQPAQTEHDIPQSIRLEHEDSIAQLTKLSKRRAPVGPAAQKALELIKQHQAREAEYILPPLTLLPLLAAGKISPDMKWAVEMADKIKAHREEIFQEHTQITDAMNALLAAADHARDAEAAEYARTAVADSLGDLEIQEPAALLVGEYLRTKLAAP
jgi:hypothetical protein